MNFWNLLTCSTQTTQGLKVLQPFVFIKQGGDGKNESLLTVYLQFDRDGLKGHKTVDLTGWDEAETVRGDGYASGMLIPLVLAHRHKADDVRIECAFSGGVLWGWFPKDFTA